MNKTYYTNLPDNKSKLYGGAYGVHDKELIEKRNQLIRDFTFINSGYSAIAEEIKSNFIITYKDWMFKTFNFKGVNLYQHACFTQGTTESFAQFYIRYRENYRLRICKGEYFYHQMMKSLWYLDKFSWLDEDDLRSGDVLLISVPFADTGMIPNDLENILTECDVKGIPVMLDFAYLNLTTGDVFDHKIDLTHDCIKYIVSSLSKAFPVENMRIGIRLQKEKYDDQIYVVNEEKYNYINLSSAFVGTGMMESFAPDYIFNKYRDKQLMLCEELNLIPSNCFNFGIDYNNVYNEYNRGGDTNRLCFSRLWDGRSEVENLKL